MGLPTFPFFGNSQNQKKAKFFLAYCIFLGSVVDRTFSGWEIETHGNFLFFEFNHDCQNWANFVDSVALATSKKPVRGTKKL